MPLQIDSLIATKVESQTITIQGAPASVLPTFIGDIYTDKQFTTIAQTETAIETLLVPANFLSGLQEGFPDFIVVTETSSDYSQLILRAYVSPTTSFKDGIVLSQETIEGTSQPEFSGTFLNPNFVSNFLLFPIAVKYDGSKISIISKGKTEGYTISTYDNFDVTVNQYLIITAEITEGSTGVKTIYTELKNSIDGGIQEVAFPELGV